MDDDQSADSATISESPAASSSAEAGGAAPLTDDHHDWTSAFCGIATKVEQAVGNAASGIVSAVEQTASDASQAVGQAAQSIGAATDGLASGVTDAAHSVEAAVTPPEIGKSLDQGIEGAIDKGSQVQKSAIDSLPIPDMLKGAADAVLTIEGGVDKGLVKVGAGLLQGAQDAVDMVDGVDLVKGAAKVTAAIANEDDRKQLLSDAESKIKSATDQAEMIVNPLGALVKEGSSVVQGYEKASAQGKGLDYVSTVAGQALGTAALIALGGGEAPGEAPAPEAPVPETPPPAPEAPSEVDVTPPERQLPARGETTRTDPSFDRTKEWIDPSVKDGENLAGLDHLSDEHAPWSKLSPDKGKFTQDAWNNLKPMIREAVQKGKSTKFKPMADGPQAGSVYEYKPGYQTGIDPRGKPLYGIRVVVDGTNQVVTAFPIK